MRVTVSRTATDCWVHIFGEVDLSNRDDLQSALSAIDFRSARGVWLDLRGLTFCDSSGCLVILRFERNARLSSHQTQIWASNPAMRKVMSFLARDCWPAESAPDLRMWAAANHG